MPKRSRSKSKSKLIKQEYARLLYLLFVLVIVLGVWVFWHDVYDNTNNTFMGMISNSLYTPSYITKITKSSSGQDSTQYILVETGAHNVTDSIDKVVVSGSTHYQITSQSIGTPIYDYARYLSIDTNAKGTNGKIISYGPIIGIWGLSPADPAVTDGQLFNETVLGVVPIGMVSPPQHAKLMSFIKQNHVYKITGVTRQTQNGRLQYVYSLNVDPSSYIEMIKLFGSDLGLNQLSGISANSLGYSIPQLKVSVDVLSRRLVSINSAGSSAQESYSSYGIRIPVQVPTKSIPISTLENKLESIH